MLSAVYQLSTDYSAPNFEKDAANRLYWRADRHRMTAEQIRDSLLFVSGSLDDKMGGPSTALSPSFNRRTVYGKVSRYKLDDYLQLFDFPSPNLSAERRFTTTVPLQRLFFMNSDFMQQQGELIARRVSAEANNTARIQKAYLLIFGRGASAMSEIRSWARVPGERAAEGVRGAEDATRTQRIRRTQRTARTKRTAKDTKNGRPLADEGDDGPRRWGRG